MAICRKCGLAIAFKRLPNGKFSPINTDGSDHWDICKKSTQATFRTKETEWFVGINYVPSVCCGFVPPWEDCRNDCHIPVFTELDITGLQHMKNI